MKNKIRSSTLETLGLGSVLDIFKTGKLPVSTEELVERIFGKKENRGAMIISGASGIVGAGKVMQFASRLLPYNVPIIALDLPGAPDRLSQQYKGLVKSFGKETADNIMKNIIRLNYDGTSLPETIKQYHPKFLLEAIPENAELKKNHYALFRKEFPGLHIFSVTSGFPSSHLGVGIAHPAFPHEVNKVFEIVESETSLHTQLLWSLGLIPISVSDDWSFVLDVFFCGLLQAGIQFSSLTNTPYWKTDKHIRRLLGPNPFRAHDAIGAKGANFLTWSCLYHLGKKYGPLFTPAAELEDRKESGQNWYPQDHFRPLVNRNLEEDEGEMFRDIVLGALIQMTSVMIHEKRADLSSMNIIGELCAQFTKGMPALIRNLGAEEAVRLVKAYHKFFPEASQTTWYPEVFQKLDTPEWQQLYVNAECDGIIGVITIGRDSYNSDVDAELNRAIDWLKSRKVSRVIVTGDFHFSTQMVGADTSDFFPAIMNRNEGERISLSWSTTARRLHQEFEISLGFINGKSCMGGMLELMMHCHYLFAVQHATLAMPEVTLPVLPGMEGCHWAIRRARQEDRKYLLKMLLEGNRVKAKDATGWLVDYADTMENTIRKAYQVMKEGKSVIRMRSLEENAIGNISFEDAGYSYANGLTTNESRRAIAKCIEDSCNATLDEALKIQAKYSADFMTGKFFRKGRIGSEFDKIMQN